jgi:hypothetical protein
LPHNHRALRAHSYLRRSLRAISRIPHRLYEGTSRGNDRCRCGLRCWYLRTIVPRRPPMPTGGVRPAIWVGPRGPRMVTADRWAGHRSRRGRGRGRPWNWRGRGRGRPRNWRGRGRGRRQWCGLRRRRFTGRWGACDGVVTVAARTPVWVPLHCSTYAAPWRRLSERDPNAPQHYVDDDHNMFHGMIPRDGLKPMAYDINDRKFNPASFRTSGRWQRFGADSAPPSIAPIGCCACARPIAMPMRPKGRKS